MKLNEIKKGAVSTGLLTTVLFTVIMALIIVLALPSILPSIITGVHNLSDNLVTSFTAVGSTGAATLAGYLDDWFAWGLVGGICVFVVLLGFGILSMRKKGYRRGYRR